MENTPAAGSPGAFSESAVRAPAGAVLPGRELRLLLHGLRSWCSPQPGEEPRDGLALLRGEAGAGKTLLLDAARGALRTLGVRAVGAECVREGRPLAAFRQLLRGLLLGVEERAGSPGERILSLVEPFLPELRRILPEVSWPRPAPPFPSLGPELDRIRVCDIVAQTFAAAARDGPLVLLLDDLGRLDSLSRDALAALLWIVRSRAPDPDPPRILMLAAIRPAEEEGLEEVLDPRLRAFEVDVRGYSREDLRDYAVSQGIDLLLTAREALHRATGGNPLLIHFTLKGAGPAPDPAALAFPDDPARFDDWFERAAAARLGSLAEAERSVLALLSLLGRPAEEDLLRRLLPPGGAPESAGAVLARLGSLGWVRRVDLDGGPVAFTLAGERLAGVVLDRLPAQELSSRRRALAECLLARLAPEPEGGGPQPFGSFREAFTCLLGCPGHPRLVEAGLTAAREAEELGSTTEAIDVLERLLERLDPQGQRELFLRTGEKLADLLEHAGFYREAIEAQVRLHAPRLAAMAPEARARHFRRLGNLHGRAGDLTPQLECYRQGLKAIEGQGKSLERLKLYAHLARVALDAGDAAESARCLRESVRFPTEGGPAGDADFLEIYRLAEEVSFRRKDYVEAIGFEELVFERASAAGDDLGLLRSAEHLGHLHLVSGDPQRSLHFLRLALERARASGNRFLIARCLAQIGRVHRSLGQALDALGHLAQARDLFAELGREDTATDLHLSLAHLQLLLFEFEEGARSLKQYAAQPPRGAAEAAHAAFPPIYADRAERDAAVEALRERLRLQTPGGAASGRAVLLSELADLLADAGQNLEASRLFEESLRSREVNRNPLRLAQILQRAGRHWWRLGDRTRALRFLEKSLEFLGPVPEKALVGNAYVEVASIFLVQGEAGKSYDYLLHGLRLFLDLGDDQGLAITTLRLAEFLRVVGLPELALHFADAAADLCHGRRLDRFEAEAHRIRGAIVSAAGDYAESARCFARSRHLIEPLGLVAEGELLQLELGREWLRRESYPAVMRIAREGIESARALGMQDLLEDFCFLLGKVESAVSNKSKNFLRALELLNQALLGAQNRHRPAVEAEVLKAVALIYRERGKHDLAREYISRAQALEMGLDARLPSRIREAIESARARHAEASELLLLVDARQGH